VEEALATIDRALVLVREAKDAAAEATLMQKQVLMLKTR
jgi:hypothetical protein